jgi:hypothetical protein
MGKMNRVEAPLNNFKGRDLASEIEKQPLHSRNVRNDQVD